MVTMTFVNQYGQVFTATSEEIDTSPLAYIKYCLDRNSILVDVILEGEK